VKDGWNYPGDAFLQDADGYFFYQARADDMIITAGYNVGGPEVEDALLKHPAVAECGVIGKPDDERGMIVKAFCVLKPGHAGDAAMVRTLQDHVKATIAPFKYPREIEFVPACRARRRASCSASGCVWTRQLAGLVGSGLTLERALTALADEMENEQQHHLVAALRAEVNAGSSFAKALARFPREFRTSTSPWSAPASRAATWARCWSGWPTTWRSARRSTPS
jgi:hypothetical protein